MASAAQHVIDPNTGFCKVHNRFEYSVLTGIMAPTEGDPVAVKPVHRTTTPPIAPMVPTYTPPPPPAPVITVKQPIAIRYLNRINPYARRVNDPYRPRCCGGECGRCCYINREALADIVTCCSCCEPCCITSCLECSCLKAMCACPWWIWLATVILFLVMLFLLIIFILESQNVINWFQ